LPQQIHRDLFDDISVHAAEHVLSGLPFQNDIVDASTLEEWSGNSPAGPAPMVTTCVLSNASVLT